MQKVPGERYVYKFLPDTMQASNPFTGQIPYPGQITESKYYSSITCMTHTV